MLCLILYLIWQGDVWIVMEVMDAPLDKFYKKIYENKDRIPEDVLSIVAFSVSVPLHSFHCCVQTTYKKA